jgi:rhodanese-related sulfurtransferase
MAEFFEFAKINWYLFVALIVILGWLIGNEVLRKLRGITGVTSMQALQLINQQDGVVLDVRDGAGYKSGHIPQALHIPASDVQKRLQELQKHRDKPIIVCCDSGATAEGVCTVLKKQGFAAVHPLSGGLSAWQNANLPLTKK